MTNPILYRKRIMPDECILLKDDIIVTCNDEVIITKWNALKPKKDLHHGYSCYFLKQGFKVSKFYREDGSLLYWYCDIVEYIYDEAKNTLTSLDLLADVIIYPDGFVKVVDLDELVIALDKELVQSDLVKKCLFRLNHLLQIIYAGKFSALQKYIEDIL
ncbi:hypothetical protein EDD76_101129 [Kineothrix alysoides]|uniref:DUF402 domain-containing protein n=1 Tax=Kineothrix alysoides TaxID=1469948 RepID=A0A4R1R6U4_9FIRM|nr:DUF402 domain-containing protein [Kineothrix alysoides]TCL61032.1 hypothetical protein EDD76_101129 [Kineothrix alysoides]